MRPPAGPTKRKARTWRAFRSIMQRGSVARGFFGLGSGILHRTGGVGGGFAGGGGSVVGGGFGVGRGFLGRGSGVGIGLFRSGGDVVGGALGGGSSVGSSLFGGGGVGGRIFLGTVNGVSAGGEGQHAGGGNGDELGVQGCSP